METGLLLHEIGRHGGGAGPQSLPFLTPCRWPRTKIRTPLIRHPPPLRIKTGPHRSPQSVFASVQLANVVQVSGRFRSATSATSTHATSTHATATSHTAPASTHHTCLHSSIRHSSLITSPIGRLTSFPHRLAYLHLACPDPSYRLHSPPAFPSHTSAHHTS